MVDLEAFATVYVGLMIRTANRRAGLALPALLAEMAARMQPAELAGALAAVERQLGLVQNGTLPEHIAELVAQLTPPDAANTG